MSLHTDNEDSDQTEWLSRVTLCADPENFVREGPTLTTFFFVLFLV